MDEKSKTNEGEETKTEAKETCNAKTNLQNILAVLLLLSLLANIYFIITIVDLNNKVSGMQTLDQDTSTSLPVVTTTPAGGIELVEAGRIVKVDYVGKFENGTVFDTSLEDEAKNAGIHNELKPYEPFSFVVGKGQVIEGFDKAVLGMKVGDEKTVTIPPEEAYSVGPLAGKTLIFRIIVREIKEPEDVNVLVINDKRCEDCDTTGLIEQLGMLFSGLDHREIDYSSDEGKKLYDELKLEYLPAVLFDKSVKDADGYTNVEMYLEPAGEYLSLKIGAKFDPAAEICDNGVDDNGDGLVDCDDPGCALKLACNKDALAECAKQYNIAADSVIFYHSEQCGYCAQMKPIVEKFQGEGYNFHWANVDDAESMEVIEKCLIDYITSGGVPQFICMKNAEIQVGAMPEEKLKEFADKCKGV